MHPTTTVISPRPASRRHALGALAIGLLLAVVGAGCSDDDDHGAARTATPTPTAELVAVNGTCALPGSNARGLGPCAAGTAITVSRCDRRSGCLHGDGLVSLAVSAVDGHGKWSVQIAAADARVPLVVTAEVADGVIYRALAFPLDGAAQRFGLTAALTVAVVPIDPVSEASVALLDAHGFDNYSDDGAQLVVAAVNNATAELSFAETTPATAPQLAESTASADPTVMSVLESAANTPTPTPQPICCNCGGGCFADTGDGCGDCSAVAGAACLDSGCATLTPTATASATPTATASSTATATATAPPPCCDCGDGCFQDTGAGCGDCVAVADAVCQDSSCVAYTATPSNTPTPSTTGTHTRTATATEPPPPTSTATASITPTSTQTPQATSTPTITETPTATGTVTATPTVTATSTATPTATMAMACVPDTCTATSECVCDTHTSVFAIAHDYNDPLTTVLYRVTVGAWSTGTSWGDGTNGFFYLATVTGNTPASLTYVPFNGMAVDSDGNPGLPQFSFIVPVDVSAGTGATSLTIAACASNQEGTVVTNSCGEQEYTPNCTATLWSETYSTLTTPAVGPAPTALTETSLEFSGTDTVSIQNTGVYPGVLTFSPQTTLSASDEAWLYNHLVFFDTEGNPYTNDIFDDCTHPSIGVLSIDEAAYSVPGQATYMTKYGNTLPVTSATSPDRQFFFYTWDRQQTSAIDVGAQFIFDYSSECPGWINGGPGSIASTCNAFAAAQSAGLPNIAPFAQVIPESTQGVFTTSASAQAGTQEIRNISISAEDNGSLCEFALNPLAVNLVDTAYSPPNYVIDDSSGDWDPFPQGLSYIVPAGFGTCTTAAPFCETTASYLAYIPHYADTNGVFGTLNGGSTDEALIGSFSLADEYALGDINQSSANTLQWFDNCGYGHSYEESSQTNPQLGTRKELPSPPNDGTTYQYVIKNSLSRAIVFGKECCASWYQENQNVTPTAWEPPVQIDNSYGAFLAPGDSLAYETLFSDEAIVIYDAGTGNVLFKLRLNPTDGAVYDCDAADFSVGISGTGPYAVTIDSAGSQSLSCGTVGYCPYGMTTSLDGATVTCTTTDSAFLLGMPEWSAGITGLTDAVVLQAWGAEGDSNTSSGGSGGYAQTALTPDELDEDLYAYVGDAFGVSSVLITQPLSLVTDTVAGVTTDPATVGVLLIAGGGGSSGAGLDTGGAGGDGGTAIANDENPSGVPVSSAGDGGNSEGASGGDGGNSSGSGDGGSPDGTAGIGGFSSGTGWNDDAALIPPQSWSAGEGPSGNDDCDYTGGKGGGGFGGGGRGGANCSGSGGGAGGGSWAAANTVYDSNAPSSAPSSPGGEKGAVQLSYALPASCTISDSSAICTLATTSDVIDLATLVSAVQFIAAINGTTVSIDDDTPMWIRAWGGAGGENDGTDSAGAGGLAQTVTTIAAYESTYGSTLLYYYVGSVGDNNHEAGKGGASTIVSSANLGETAACLPPTSSGCVQNILLIAGGGGGAGSADDGGAGGTAIASKDSSAQQAGASSDDAGGGGLGVGGSANGTGDGGSAGNDGIGGMGGPVHTGSGPSTATGWLNGEPTQIGTAGEGGEGKHDNDSGYLGGGGGGGWGGGGGGGAGGSEGHGGGGGGSYAIAGTESASVPSGSPSSDNGEVEIGFVLSD